MKKINLFFIVLIIVVMGNSCKQKGNDQNIVDQNPLLQTWDTPFGVPPFDLIKYEHYEPAFEFAMKEQKENIDKIINNEEEPNFVNTIEALEFSGLLLSKVGGVFYNMLSSNTNDSLQAIAQRISPSMSKHGDEISMNPELFKRVEEVYLNKDKFNLDKEQLKVLELTYKSFVKGGA
ncbi:MAG: peptidase M3, partial [Bacteroidales bacterium]|nr:peptidase M3 [Bacteroidales bacterium]